MCNFLDDNFLGKAANAKDKAKLAIKERRFDDAWGYLHEQKNNYINHALKFKFTEIEALCLESVVHIDMAHIYKLEKNYLKALVEISFAYKVNFFAKRPVATLRKKIPICFKKVYKNDDVERYIRLLEHLKGIDYLSVLEFTNHYSNYK